MNTEPLVGAIITAMMLLEESEPEQVDPDTAVRGLEHMGAELMRLTGDDRTEFLTLLERLADEAGDEHTARFIRAIPFSIGMTLEPPTS
jgi:hypothetical protein